MIAFDTSFLLDYLDGVEDAGEYVATHDDEFVAPTLALFEVYRGAARSGGPEEVTRVASALDWLDPLVLDHAAVHEAAVIEAELRDAGRPINLADTLIAGVCRHHDARVVTRDDHFEHVSDLSVERY
ncbi:MAG: PIN domain-containing protein [Halobaculum sp.]